MKPVGLNNPTREEGRERENARPMPGVSFPFCRRQAVRAWVAPTMPVAHVAVARSPFLGCRPRSLNGPCRLFPTGFGAEPGHQIGAAVLIGVPRSPCAFAAIVWHRIGLVRCVRIGITRLGGKPLVTVRLFCFNDVFPPPRSGGALMSGVALPGAQRVAIGYPRFRVLSPNLQSYHYPNRV